MGETIADQQLITELTAENTELRTNLAGAAREIEDWKFEVHKAWDELDKLKAKLKSANTLTKSLRKSNAALRQSIRCIQTTLGFANRVAGEQ